MRARLAFVVAALGCHPAGSGPAALKPEAATVVPPPAAVAAAPAAPAAPVAPPAPADPPPNTDGDVTEAWVHGMQILVKRIPGAETTATQLYIRGGVTNWSKADAGIEQLALGVAASGGTAQLPKDPFTQRLNELGATLRGRATEDFSILDGWSLTPSWDATFAMLVDAFRHPALPPAQIELVRARQLSSLQHELDDPDGRVALVAHLGMFKGHPYENRAIGTLETVAAFTAGQLAAHLTKLRETSRLLLVVVGDVAPAHVIAAAGQALGDLPRGHYQAKPLPAVPSPPRGSVTVVEQKLPTNYLLALFPGPAWRDPDFVAARVAMSALGQREFKEVRTKRNLSYAPGAWLDWDRGIPTGALYVTAVDPVATMKVMLDEAKRLRDEPIPDHELAATKATMLTATFTGGEAPADQASQLAHAQLHGGDWRLVRSLADRVRAVTAAQVQAWAANHLARVQTFVVGDPSKLDRPTLEAF